MKNGTVKVILDRAQEFESRGRTITLGEVLDFYADAEEGKESSALVNEETGEIDLSALVAKLVGGKYWRDLALSQDAARAKAKLAPSKVYRARLGDVAPEAQAIVEAARVEAAKAAGITLADPKPAKAPAVEPLAEAMAKALADPKPAKAPKAAKSYAAVVVEAEAQAKPAKAPKAKKAPKAAKLTPETIEALAVIEAASKKVSPEMAKELESTKLVTLDNGSTFKVESY